MDSNCQRGAVVTGAARGDVRQKISKLEADSRQLCRNLRNLEMNRAKLTNEAVVLARVLENPALSGDQTEEAANAEPADCIRVLLDAKRAHREETDPYRTGHKCCYEESSKNDCCTICTCSECEDCSETATDVVEEKDLAVSLRRTAISADESEGHERCYICYKNSAAVFDYPERAADATVDNFKSAGSEKKANFFSARNDRCEVCRCELDDRKELVPNDNFTANLAGEERCRGGMDRVECKFWPLAPLGEARNERNPMELNGRNERARRVCEGCECNLCDLRNVDGSSPPCLTTSQSSGIFNDGDSVDELGVSSGDAPAKLQQICKVEKLREVLEQLKNRNHALRKMLNDCDCLNPCDVESLALVGEKTATEIREEPPEARGEVAGSASDLIATVKDLQMKCRTKDGMILALAEALKKLSSPDRTDRIFARLTNPCEKDSPIRDMDRSELWKYLRSPKNNERQTQRCPGNAGPDESDEGTTRNEEPSKCGCATYARVSPPRDLKIVARIGEDTLEITWQPPESGPITAYEVFVDEQLIARSRKTRAVLRSLDFTSPRLIEVLAIDPTGRGSATIEKLFDPARFVRSKTR